MSDPLPTVVRTSLDEILPVLRDRLVAATGLPPERVLVLQREQPPFDGHGDHYVWLRVEDGQFDMPDVLGAGRIDAREEVVFTVTVRSRLAADEANNDFRWLTDESLGHLRVRHAVLDAMLCFQPEDADGNWLITEPIKPAKTRRPAKDEGKNRPNKEWGESSSAWVLRYELDLDQTYQ